MAKAKSNSVAAILSLLLRAIYWLAILAGAACFVFFGIGLLGSLNGGTLELPFMQAISEDVPVGRIVGTLVGTVIFAAGTAFVCDQLRRILTTLADGDPFVPQNGPRLTRIAATIALLEILRNATMFILAGLFELGEGFEPQLSISFTAWGAVIVLFVLAQVFQEGSRLREEEKMTI